MAEVMDVETFARMTPAQQDDAFDASILRDLDAAPDGLIERVRARLEARLSQPEDADRR